MWLSGGNCTSSTLHGGADHPLCTAPVIFWSGDQQSGSFGGRRAESKWDSGSWETTRSGRASQTELGGPRRTRQPTRRESKRWATRTCAPTCYSRGRPTAPVQFFYIKIYRNSEIACSPHVHKLEKRDRRVWSGAPMHSDRTLRRRGRFSSCRVWRARRCSHRCPAATPRSRTRPARAASPRTRC